MCYDPRLWLNPAAKSNIGRVDTCACCGRYRVEAAMLDRLDGHGPRPEYRLRQDGHVLATYRTPDELVAELDKRGIQIEIEDGCE